MKNKIVFIGNSIVNGFPMSRGRSFPGQVRKALKEGLAVPVYADVINKGVNGETTADILRRFEEDVLAHEAKTVFIMTGTNDFIFREADPAGCMNNLSKMAGMSLAAGIRPVYMTPLPVHTEKAGRMWMAGVGVDYKKTNEQIEAFSEMIRQSGQLYIDSKSAYEAFMNGGTGLPLQEGLEYPANSEDAFLDGVHPTPEGHRFLAGIVLDWLGAHCVELGLK